MSGRNTKASLCRPGSPHPGQAHQKGRSPDPDPADQLRGNPAISSARSQKLAPWLLHAATRPPAVGMSGGGGGGRSPKNTDSAEGLRAGDRVTPGQSPNTHPLHNTLYVSALSQAGPNPSALLHSVHFQTLQGWGARRKASQSWVGRVHQPSILSPCSPIRTLQVSGPGEQCNSNSSLTSLQAAAQEGRELPPLG